MKEEFLTFNNCIRRLKNSFVLISQDSIDFQHPSLRDFLLNLLKDKPDIRKNCIKLASPNGIAEMILGLTKDDLNISKNIMHYFIIKENEELKLLNKRIEQVLSDSIKVNLLLKILNNCLILIPNDNGNYIKPSTINLVEFNSDKKGIILKIVLDSISKELFYKNNLSYSPTNWNEILKKFYLLTTYIIDFNHPFYLNEIIKKVHLEDIYESIPFLIILFENEPLLFKQNYSDESIGLILDSLIIKLTGKNDEGDNIQYDNFGPDDTYADMYYYYEQWKAESVEILDLAHNFYSSFNINEPAIISDLEFKIEERNPPYGGPEEPNWEEYDNYSIDYWSIEEIFDDL